MSERPGRWLPPGVRRIIPLGATALLVVAVVGSAGAAGGASPALVHMSAAVPAPARQQVRVAAVPPPVSGSRYVSSSVPVAQSLATKAVPVVAPLRHLHEPDVIVVARASLPASAVAAVRRLPGVQAATSIDAARIRVNGTLVAMIGVDPSSFRSFAARPTASSNRLWQNVAAGGIAVSYDMGKQDHLPLGGMVHVAGRVAVGLHIAGFATAGIGGIDAVVSHETAASVGLPAGNAIVVSAPNADLPALAQQIKRLVPAKTAVQPLVYTVMVGGVSAGGAGVAGGATIGPTLTSTEVSTMLAAALSRQGMPYVWGAEGPTSFDCSGLVQWSFARAGIAMPRVAADQARTGPLVPFSQVQPGDLMFWRTDPTAPGYISHVAIYIGDGQMIQAPQPGQNVEVVPAMFGSGFAGVVQVRPQVAVSIAG